MQQEERRTGARVFVLSGAVGDDPGVLSEAYIGNIVFELTQGNKDCTGNMTDVIHLLVPYIHKDRCTASPGRERFFQTDAGHRRFTLRK